MVIGTPYDKKSNPTCRSSQFSPSLSTSWHRLVGTCTAWRLGTCQAGGTECGSFCSLLLVGWLPGSGKRQVHAISITGLVLNLRAADRAFWKPSSALELRKSRFPHSEASQLSTIFLQLLWVSTAQTSGSKVHQGSVGFGSEFGQSGRSVVPYRLLGFAVVCMPRLQNSKCQVIWNVTCNEELQTFWRPW